MKYTPCTNIDSIFKFYINDDKITYDDIMNLQNKEEMMSNIIKEVHKYKITYGKDGRWSTYIFDPTSPNGRRLVRKKSHKELIGFLLNHYHIPGNNANISFDALYHEWVNYKRKFIGANNRKKSLSPSTIRRYEREFDKYFKNTKLYTLSIGEVTTPKLSVIITDMIKSHDMSEKCASNVIGYVTGAFKYAYESEYILKDPAARLDRNLLLSLCTSTSEKDDSKRVLYKSEIKKLMNTLSEHKASHPSYMPDYAIELALLTGVRVGELSTLKYEDFDYENNVIHIVRAERRFDYSDGTSTIVIGLPKNGKKRHFPMTERTLELLEEIKALQMPSPEGYVFVREDGSRYTGHDIGCATARRGHEAGIGEISIHEIRRTVSSFLNTILPRRVVSEMLGHTDSVNARNYDFSTAELAEMKQAVNEVYSNVFNFSGHKSKTKKIGKQLNNAFSDLYTK